MTFFWKGKLCNINGKQALEFTGKYHTMRNPVRSKSPQSETQCRQVQRLVDDKNFKILD